MSKPKRTPKHTPDDATKKLADAAVNVRVQFEADKAARTVRIAARRAEHERRTLAARSAREARLAPRAPTTWETLAQRHCRSGG